MTIIKKDDKEKLEKLPKSITFTEIGGYSGNKEKEDKKTSKDDHSCPSQTPFFEELRSFIKFNFRERCFGNEQKYNRGLTDTHTGRLFKDGEVFDAMITLMQSYRDRDCEK